MMISKNRHTRFKPARLLCLATGMLLLFGSSVYGQGAFIPQPSVTLPAALDRVLRDYEQAWAAGEAARLAALFVEDGYVPSDAGWIRGHKAIEAKYSYAGGDLQLRAIHYATEGDVGFIIGAYGYAPDAAVDRGNFVLALRRSPEGKWLIVADLDKTNR